MPIGLSERQIQRQIVDYLRYRGWCVLQTYLGSKRGGSVWMTKGLPDLCAIKHGRHVWLEVKTPRGRLSPEQAALHAEMRRNGAEVYVVRSVEDAINAVKQHRREEIVMPFMDLATLLQKLADVGATVFVESGRVGIRPRAVLAGLEEHIKQHKWRLIVLAAAEGGTMTPERLAELAHSMADTIHPLGAEPANPEDPPWWYVPYLPRNWRDLPLTNSAGCGRSYKLNVRGVWLLITFLPPYDGRVLISTTGEKVHMLPSLDDALQAYEVLDK